MMICEWLSRLEGEYGIDILYACEAGSRSWKIESSQSDYDVRFIFKQKKIRNYLALAKQPEILAFTLPVDGTGHDIYKMMALIGKSNPGIYEWAFSPLVYSESEDFSSRLRNIIIKEYSPASLFKHYESLKNRNVKELIKKDAYNSKHQKQLILAVRAELICKELLRTKEIISPYETIANAKAGNPALYEGYKMLTEAKQKNEMISGSSVKMILHMLQKTSFCQSSSEDFPQKRPDLAVLEKWLKELLGISERGGAE